MPPTEHTEAEQIEVVYENGVLRPVHPLDLAEGTRLEVTLMSITTGSEIADPIIRVPPSAEQEKEEEAEVDEASYAAFLGDLDRIADLPLQSAAQPHTVRDHDAILYPKQGSMP